MTAEPASDWCSQTHSQCLRLFPFLRPVHIKLPTLDKSQSLLPYIQIDLVIGHVLLITISLIGSSGVGYASHFLIVRWFQCIGGLRSSLSLVDQSGKYLTCDRIIVVCAVRICTGAHFAHAAALERLVRTPGFHYSYSLLFTSVTTVQE